MALTVIPTRETNGSGSSSGHARLGSEAEARQKPTLRSLQDLSTRVFEALVNFQATSPKTSDKTMKAGQRGTIAEEVRTVKTLRAEVTKLRTDCETLQEESQSGIDSLSNWHPCHLFDKFSFILTKRDVFWFWGWLNHKIDRHNHNNEAFSSARAALQELNDRIHVLVQVKLEFLSHYRAAGEEVFDLVTFYDELSSLEPANSLPLERLSAWLLGEGAFDEAEKILAALVQRHPEKNELHLQLILALIGKGEYDEAEEKIRQMKLRLTLNEDNRPCLITPAIQLALTQLDKLKADCFAHRKQYPEALDILKALQKKDLHNHDLIQKIAHFTVCQEIEPLSISEALAPAAQKFFLAGARQMFARLPEYTDTAFSNDNLISDVEFWLDVLFSHIKLYENQKIRDFILLQIKDLVESGRISPSLTVQKLEARLIKLTEEHDSFKNRLYSFVKKSVVPREARQAAILKARKLHLERTLQGDSSLNGSIGLVRKKELATLILKNLLAHKSFQDDENRTTVACLIDRVSSQKFGKGRVLQLQHAGSMQPRAISSSS